MGRRVGRRPKEKARLYDGQDHPGPGKEIGLEVVGRAEDVAQVNGYAAAVQEERVMPLALRCVNE